MTIQPPVIDGRNEAEVLKALDDRAPGFTPEWKRSSDTPDNALARIFARYSGILLEGLGETPRRSFLAFLDMLGAHLLPAEPARAPLVFTLQDNATTDPSVAANSQVAAPAQPPAPSPLLGSEAPSGKVEAAVFATEKEITLARAKLAALYSIDPGSDAFADHTSRLTAGFTLFDDMQQVEHALYLGHDRLYALAANAEVRLAIQFAPLKAGRPRPLDIGWEYLSKDGWLPLIVGETADEIARNDTTNQFTQSGQIVIRKSCGPDAKEETFNGQKSYWIRGKLRNLLPPESGSENAGPVPVVDTIRTRVSFVKTDLLAEAAGTDGFSLDISTNFFPFGKQPERYTTFYLASKEVFQRQGARVRIDVALSKPASPQAETNLTNATAVLAWEYFDGTNWRSIQNSEFQDGTKDFKEFKLIGAVSFLCPTDWAETSVNGTKNYWLRARIDSGDYGHPLRLKVTGTGATTKVDADESTLEPPVIQSLKLQYSYQTDSETLDHCLAFNDFAFTDHTHECQWPRLTFEPFLPVRESQPAVHFGFNQALPSGLVSIFLQPPPAVAEQGGSEIPSFVWEYRNETGWSELGVLDETVGFQRSGMIQFIGEPDAVAVPGLGGSLFRIRARLKVGELLTPAAVDGIWLNAVWATHREIVKREEIGVSDGNPFQTFYLRPRTAIDTGTESIRGTPIIEGRAIQLPPQAVQIPGDPVDQQTLEVPSGTIEVREWSGHGRDWENAIQDIPQERRRDEVGLEYDPTSRTVREVWVRWQPKPHLFKSLPADRHFVMERAIGSIRFGDGAHGRIPTSGNRIVATYATGGGLGGNVAAGKITELRSAVPFLKSVSNPIPALGGAATEALAAVMPRGAESFRNGGRAISPRDIEWVARDASPGVARAHCLPVTGPIGRVQRGWFTVSVLPLTEEAQPNPSPELRRVVREHLAAFVPAAVSGRIRVIAPSYVPVGILAEVVSIEPEKTAQVEARILKQLEEFLHPLRGGTDGSGWPFGQPLHYSQIARLLEQTPGVDYVVTITLRVGSELFDEMVPVPPDSLIASGDHELKMTLGER